MLAARQLIELLLHLLPCGREIGNLALRIGRGGPGGIARWVTGRVTHGVAKMGLAQVTSAAAYGRTIVNPGGVEVA